MKQIGTLLKKARIEKGLSQRALSAIAGLPQAHISKIESGLVDLQTSSLIELARALDLELMLVPRILMRTVTALTRGMDGKDTEPRPKYHIDHVDELDEGEEDQNE
jgi:transcriptional regulator with XRE-family HTH domain